VAAIKAVREAVGGSNIISLMDAKNGVEAGLLELPADRLTAAAVALLPYADVGNMPPMEYREAVTRLVGVCKRLLARPIQKAAEALEALEQRL